MQKHNEKARQLVKDQLQARLKKVVTEYFRKEKDKNVTVSDKELKTFVNTSIRLDSITLAIERTTAVKISAKANDAIKVIILPKMLGRVGQGGVGGGVGGFFAGAGAGAGIGALVGIIGGPVGIAIGAAIGAGIGAGSGAVAGAGGALECLPSVHGGVIGVDVGCCCVVSCFPSTNVDFVVEDHCLGTIHPHW